MSIEGKQVGAYLIEEEIARGGMGVVYKGRSIHGSEVAIKVLLDSADGDDLNRKRFEREAEALGRLSHANIVRVLDAGLHKGHPYLVLEYVRGESLEDVLRRSGPLSPREAAKMVRKLALALQHAHAAGVLHRDIKPANVILTQAGDPRLTDFGLAKNMDESQARLSMSGYVLGSPGYWPPEQARGDIKRIDRRADVYGLGALLYALLTGNPPFQGKTLAEVAVATVEDAITPPSEVGQRVPPRLEAICLKCLEREPEDRYQTIDEVSADLQAFLRAPDEGSGANQTQLAVAALGGLTVVLLGALLLIVSTDDVDDPEPAPTKTAVPVEPKAEEPRPKPPAVAELYERGQRHFQAKKDLDALQALTEALRRDPVHVGARCLRARTHFRLEDLDAALADAERALELDARAPEGYEVRGGVQQHRKLYDQALPPYTRWAELAPESAEAHRRRGQVLRKLKRPREAEAAYSLVLKIDPRDKNALFIRSTVRFRRGDMRGAIADCTRLIEVKPESVSGWFTRGSARLRLGKTREGIADLTQALELSPGYVNIRENRASAYNQLKDYRNTALDLEQILRYKRNHPKAANYRSFIQKHLGRASKY